MRVLPRSCGPPSGRTIIRRTARGRIDSWCAKVSYARDHGLEPAHVRAQGARHLRARTSRSTAPSSRPPPRSAMPGAACGAARTCSASRTAPARPTTRRCCCAARRCAARSSCARSRSNGGSAAIVLVLLGVAVLRLKSTQVSLQDLFQRDLQGARPVLPADPLPGVGLEHDQLDREGAAREAVDADRASRSR